MKPYFFPVLCILFLHQTLVFATNPPTNFAIEVIEGGVRLTWKDTALDDDENPEFIIERFADEYGQLPATTPQLFFSTDTFYVDKDVTYKSTYTYRVKKWNSDYSQIIRVVYVPNFIAQIMTEGVRLEWCYTPKSDAQEFEFIMERISIEGQQTEEDSAGRIEADFEKEPTEAIIFSTVPDKFSYLDENVNLNTHYTYRIAIGNHYLYEISLVYGIPSALLSDIQIPEYVEYDIESDIDYEKGKFEVQIKPNPTLKVHNITLKYRGLIENTLQEVPMYKDLDNYYKLSTLDKDLRRDQGVEYFFEIQDIFGKIYRTTPQKAAIYFKGKGLETPDLHITWKPYRQINKTSYKDRNLISIPLQLDEPSMDKTLINQIKTINSTKNKEGRNYILYQMPDWKKVSGKYPNELKNFEQGQSYWLVIRPKKKFWDWLGVSKKRDKTKRFYTGAGKTSIEPITIPLQKGWNHVGNPYNFSVRWESILYNRNKNDFQIEGYAPTVGKLENPERLERFGGALVFVHDIVTKPNLTIPFVSDLSIESNGRIEENHPPLSAKNWSVSFSLEGCSGEFRFGMNSKAQLSRDKFDRMDLPRQADETTLHFPHTEYFYPHFSTDIVSTDSVHEWQFTVKNSDGYGRLEWNNSYFGNNSKQLILHDLENEMQIDMRQYSEYQFDGKKEHHFKIYFGDKSAQVFQNITPKKLIVGYPYPNPARHLVQIPFTINQEISDLNLIPITAQMVIYDLAGKKVHSQKQENLKVGFHEFGWNLSCSNHQTRISPGVYFCRIHLTGQPPETRKIIINP